MTIFAVISLPIVAIRFQRVLDRSFGSRIKQFQLNAASKIGLRGSFSTNASHQCLDEATNASLGSGHYDPPSHDAGDVSLVVSKQPGRKSSKVRAARAFSAPFNDAHSDRAWHSGMCECSEGNRSLACQILCWPVYRYTLATRLGETPFMPLIPCAAFALRIKVRTMFGIKVSRYIPDLTIPPGFPDGRFHGQSLLRALRRLSDDSRDGSHWTLTSANILASDWTRATSFYQLLKDKGIS
ncbi:hypothetical protein ElyMa_001578500 [Elysia marginata]|uniref:Uncharacterized protein n=1 Tax=Elysia marginata TaxID=1093978 RepID=A0AAV4JFE1_9GAST|nr:hypothetical protein ElyMa_001578500 [Elysia marginata]